MPKLTKLISYLLDLFSPEQWAYLVGVTIFCVSVAIFFVTDL
jgi:hypothetical protein